MFGVEGKRSLVGLLAIFVIAAAVTACAALEKAVTFRQASADAAATIPPGPEGELISYGRNVFNQTPTYAGRYIGARMSCAACHPGGGTIRHEGSLLGQYAKFPQWNSRSHRFIALQDRVAECFLYSMNGRPPPYESREMIAVTAYIAWLSRGAIVGEGFLAQGQLNVSPPNQPNAARGAAVYASTCMRCHGADGNGSGAQYPPLWGAQSFAHKAGMDHVATMARFVYAAMPADHPLTLTPQEAFDVAAFVLSHPRPSFKGDKIVRFPPEPARYF